MRVAVMCGGKGTRLGEPIKCLTEVAGRPFMDWKLEQLRRMGATKIELIAGPFAEAFAERYESDDVDIFIDFQRGIPAALWYVDDKTHWTMGDVLLEQPLTRLSVSTMYVRRDANPNIAGIYLDCGLYFGKANFRLVETEAQPWHINTRTDLEACEDFLRHSVVG